jgi:hypothetical protein
VKRAVVLALVGLALAATAGSARAFTPTDPLTDRQWYLAADRVFDAWPTPPELSPVRVAVIDSGIDLEHPDLIGHIALARSFVGGLVADQAGHGTFVAGIIAAGLDNGVGIAGMAFSAQLVVAKVVGADGTIDPDLEARAIRWAVDNGARVVNLSLGGVRDPLDPRRDTFSDLERSAVEYAYSKGAVVVAAVGNGDQAPTQPWNYASYPAALPHVIGVGAIGRNGDIPAFSNRDAVYVDLVAPGDDIFSTLPRTLTAAHPTCEDQGYSDCGSFEFRNAGGTSFAAPQVSAAAALLLAVRPSLTADQVAAILERSASDVNAATGCRQCPLQRDRYSGWGRLDVAAALASLDGPLPPIDRYESNDNAGTGAYTLWGQHRVVDATIDFWDDQVDVYRVRVRAGQTLAVSVHGPAATDTNLILWRPGTRTVDGLSTDVQSMRAAASLGGGSNEVLRYHAVADGWYYVEVKLSTPGSGAYTLRVDKM